MEEVISMQKVAAGYRDRSVLHEISLSVATGERLLLIGPNGCGKTTLLKVLAGALRPSSGSVSLKGQDVAHVPLHLRVRAGLGYLMQTGNTFPSLTVSENLHLSHWRSNRNYTERQEWLMDLFPMLRDRSETRAGLLSGGERQALAISMVLMRPVDLLLLDEPTAGLSPKTANTILEGVHRAQDSGNFTSVIVEHNLRIVHQWVSRILIMNQGRIVGEEHDPAVLLDHAVLQRYYFG